MAVTDVGSKQRRRLPPRDWVILLVDDEPDILRTLSELLEAALPGLRVLRAVSGRQGIAILNGERVDAIIADFKMNGMDGIEFLYIARQGHPNIPRVMLTAYGDAALAARATQEAAVQAFISKAASPDEFVDQVAALLTYEPDVKPGP